MQQITMPFLLRYVHKFGYTSMIFFRHIVAREIKVKFFSLLHSVHKVCKLCKILHCPDQTKVF
jgi:hypothetical protein